MNSGANQGLPIMRQPGCYNIHSPRLFGYGYGNGSGQPLASPYSPANNSYYQPSYNFQYSNQNSLPLVNNQLLNKRKNYQNLNPYFIPNNLPVQTVPITVPPYYNYASQVPLPTYVKPSVSSMGLDAILIAILILVALDFIIVRPQKYTKAN